MGQELKVGDIVQLRSGSPPMTIKSIVGTMAKCIYFDNKKEVHENDFELVVLVKYAAPKSSGRIIRV